PRRASGALCADPRGGRSVILFGSNAYTELLAMRAVADGLPDEIGPVRWFHTDRIDGLPDLGGVRVVVVRLLGGPDAWASIVELRERCLADDIGLVALGGEPHPDPDLLALSTVPAGVVAEAHRYVA